MVNKNYNVKIEVNHEHIYGNNDECSETITEGHIYTTIATSEEDAICLCKRICQEEYANGDVSMQLHDDDMTAEIISCGEV